MQVCRIHLWLYAPSVRGNFEELGPQPQSHKLESLISYVRNDTLIPCERERKCLLSTYNGGSTSLDAFLGNSKRISTVKGLTVFQNMA